ncbi:MAG TPA: molybdopterin cofactor-binding domain-containing protein [Gaiellaceae bacterium]|nr:molybdopterin cofactor-binding domain-containing protein [Gaiellaceae bacterium]
MAERSRRAFLTGGGALVVGFALAGGRSAAARAAPGPPDLSSVDSFVAVHADGTASIATGRVELGQGTTTGLLLVAAEELELPLDRLRFVRHVTDVTPATGGTLGSSSIALAGARLRSATATAREALLERAAAVLGVPVSALAVRDGLVSGGGRSVGYGELVGGRVLGVAMAAPAVAPGAGPAKPVSAYRLVGRGGVPRVDLPAKVAGTYPYVHSLRLPGMLHGRVVRPRGQGAYGAGTATGILSVDERPIRGLGDARVVRRGDFLGVVATREVDAIEAAQRLAVVYAEPPRISGNGGLWGQMRAFDAAGLAPARRQQDVGDVDAALAAAPVSLAASYSFDYQAHVPIGPSCALADVTADRAVVLANTQDAYRMRASLAELLGLAPERIRVEYWEGASCFGNAPARFDAGEAAALMSQLAGAPVRLQLMRWDEHGWDNYSPAVLADVRGAVDAEGRLAALDYTVFGIPEMAMTGVATLQHAGLPLQPPGLGSAAIANAGTQYDIPNRRVSAKSLPLWDTYFKTSALRGPLTPQTCFACEQMVDELAHAAGADPFAFRLANVTSAQVNDGSGQWRDALVAAARLARWEPRVAASRLSRDTVVRGRGIAIGGFAGSQVGVVAEVEVDRRTGRIRARRLHAAQVAGLTVYPDGVTSQLEGNLVMGASRALHEQVVFGTRRVTSLDWSTYPIMRFRDHPEVRTAVVQRPDLAPTGSGEPCQAPVAAAIANAFFDATGVRIRQAPMTPGRVRAVLAAAEAGQTAAASRSTPASISSGAA